MRIPPALRTVPYAQAAALCTGLVAADLVRAPLLAAWTCCLAAVVAAFVVRDDLRLGVVSLAAFLLAWGWGGARLDALDRSPLTPAVGTSERATAVVTAPVRASRFQLRVPVSVTSFGELSLREPALLQLPLGRSPPEGAVIETVAVVKLPRPAENGFDERTWLRRHGVHVVLSGSDWRLVGHRGGVGGAGDELRTRVARTIAVGLRGERRALVEGVVLGADEGLSDDLKVAFRRSGLYHLLAVSGQNVVIVGGGVLWAAWIAGVPRMLGHLAALAAIGGYVLAVGPQPSVIRAGVAGALGSIAWLAARQRDRWYFLLLGAIVLLAWNPYTLLDAGFQLSFAAVAAIFVVAPWLLEVLEGYPLPRALRAVAAISTACGVVTAPILWLQFGAVPLLSVPANALADPAVVPLLALSGASAVLEPIAPGAAAAAAWLNGWCATYLAACARLVAAVPFAQARGAAAGVVAVGGVVAGAYAWRRWRRPR